MLLVGAATGKLYPGSAYDNHFPYGTPFPPGHWIDVQVGDASACWVAGGSWLWVVQRSAIISVFWFTDNDGTNLVALPYNEPVWIYGYPTDTWGFGCTVWPEQTLTFTSNSTGWVNDPGSGQSVLLSCSLHCPNSP
jgi:hypothetical protein